MEQKQKHYTLHVSYTSSEISIAPPNILPTWIFDFNYIIKRL